MSVSGVLEHLENCTFVGNNASSGPAVFNIGTIDEENPVDLEFGSNSLICDDGQYIDYVEPVLSDEAAASVNASAEVSRLGSCGDGALKRQDNDFSKRVFCAPRDPDSVTP